MDEVRHGPAVCGRAEHKGRAGAGGCEAWHGPAVYGRARHEGRASAGRGQAHMTGQHGPAACVRVGQGGAGAMCYRGRAGVGRGGRGRVGQDRGGEGRVGQGRGGEGGPGQGRGEAGWGGWARTGVGRGGWARGGEGRAGQGRGGGEQVVFSTPEMPWDGPAARYPHVLRNFWL